MLTELKRIHDELLQCIVTLEEVVARPIPDKEGIATARWKLTRASGRRRRLLTERVYPALEAVPVVNTPKLQELRSEGNSQLATSSRHIAKWTVDQIVANWSEYQRASAAMTAIMRKRMAVEKIVLYPLLRLIA
jgi:hypothetical protein